MTSRDEFEKWAFDNHHGSSRDKFGNYESSATAWAYDAWQAAIASMGDVVLWRDVEDLVASARAAVARMKEFPGLNCDTEEVIIWLSNLKESGQKLSLSTHTFTTQRSE